MRRRGGEKGEDVILENANHCEEGCVYKIS